MAASIKMSLGTELGLGPGDFDLTPDLGENDHFSFTRQGSVRLVLKFGTALAEPVSVIAYAEFQNVIEIDRHRNVIYDFSV